MYISVYTAYTALKDLANKDQRGFISPDTFNAIATPSQQMIFNQMFDAVRRKNRVRQGQIDGAFHLSTLTRLKEDLSIYAKDLPINFTSGVADKPNDFAYAISAELSDGTEVPILYDENKFRRVRNSTLLSYTTEKPFLLMSNSLQVTPSATTQVTLRYYKQPEGIDANGDRTQTMPTYQYTTINSLDTYDGVNSVDFELPEHYLPYLLIEMGRMIGLNLRDIDVQRYSAIAQKDNDIMVNANQ